MSDYNPWTSQHLNRIGETRDTQYGIYHVRGADGGADGPEDTSAATGWLKSYRYHWITVHAYDGGILTGWVWIGPGWEEKSYLTVEEVIADHTIERSTK